MLLILTLILIFPEMKSEAVKILKGEYLLKAICELKMDQAIIFCRTKLDCDNIEKYLLAKGNRMLHLLLFNANLISFLVLQ